MKDKNTLPHADIWPPYPGKDPEIAAATEYVRTCIDDALQDPCRPKLHFAPPAKEMLDVWGATVYDGAVHLFYDLNVSPAYQMGGSLVQLKTTDLLHFEPMPISLLASKERQEVRCNDGAIVIRNDGTPLMYYTSVFVDSTRPREHVAALGTKDMVLWERTDEGTLTLENHGGPTFRGGWSDVLFFTEGGHQFMIISKCETQDGKNQIPIYEATDDTLLHWHYRGIFFEDNGEVINFLKIDGKWVLIFCPYQNPIWYVGDFDAERAVFCAQSHGILSYGYLNQGYRCEDISRGFYATTAFPYQGTPTIYGWISGFDAPKGWNGAISFPRKLFLTQDNQLRMLPHDALLCLRADSVSLHENTPITAGQCWEAACRFDGDLSLQIGDISLTVTKEEVRFYDVCVPIQAPLHSLRLFCDVSIAELFFDDGSVCITRAIPALDSDTSLCLTSEGAGVTLYTLQDNKKDLQ